MSSPRIIDLLSRGELHLRELSNAHKMRLRAAETMAGDLILTLPGVFGAGGYFHIDADGVASLLAGSATLDSAYDSGRIITADAGAVEVNGAGGIKSYGPIRTRTTPWADVIYHGADPLGIVECSAAIQAAIDSIPAAGGTVFFPAGTYKVAPNIIHVDRSKIRLLGEPGSKLVLTDSAIETDVMLNFVGSPGAEITDIVIHLLELDGNSSHADLPYMDGSQAHLIHFLNVKRAMVSGCYLHDSCGDGIRFNYNSTENFEIFIINNVIDGALRNGISCAPGYRVVIDGNIIKNWNTDGIDIEPDNSNEKAQYITVTNNYLSPAATWINQNNSNRYAGISCKAAGGVSEIACNTRILGNIVVGLEDAGIQYPLTGINAIGYRGVTILANQVYECGQGIYTASDLNVNGTTGEIIGNHIRRCRASGGAGIGVFSHMSVIGNVVEFCANVGIYVYRADNTVHGNICRACGKASGGTMRHGILVEVGGNVLTGNRCANDHDRNIATIIGNGTTVTVTMPKDIADNTIPHDMEVGETVTIAGTVNFNGNYTISEVVDDGTFKFLNATVASEAVGTASVYTQQYGIYIANGATGVTVTSNDLTGNVTGALRRPPTGTNYIFQNAGDSEVMTPAFDGLVIGGKRWTTGTTAPASGTWAIGDICINTNPSAPGIIGWICITAGTPGTWNQFGNQADIIWTNHLRTNGISAPSAGTTYCENLGGGTVTISDPNKYATVTFAVNEPDANYHVIVTANATDATDNMGQAFISNKAVDGFRINIQVAPGTGKSVTYSWLIFRI